MNLVETKRNEIYTDSLIYAKEFGIVHRNLMIKMRELTALIPCSEKYWKLDVFKNTRGREYERFLINKKGFMFLVMNTETRGEHKLKIMEIQDKFVDAFFKMEQELATIKVNQANVEWKKSRELGKSIRLELTDTIKNYVEYATSQGSKNSKMYYANITKMEYKALGLMQQKNPKLRELLDSMELFQLLLAEDLVKRQIKKYMEDKLHYKEIYLLVKQDLDRYSSSLLIGK